MNTPSQHVRPLPATPAGLWSYWPWFMMLGLLLLGALSWDLRVLIFKNLADAWLQVSVFVALTLGSLYALERFLHIDPIALLCRYPRAQVPIAAFLGALPGCGGAVVVATQYIRGTLSFGALTATLTATMGDAAFLLLAREPKTGLLVMGTGLLIGTSYGWLIDWVGWGPGLYKRQGKPKSRACATDYRTPSGLEYLWILLFGVGLIFGVALLLQEDPNLWFGSIAHWEPASSIGFLGGILALFLFARSGGRSPAHGEAMLRGQKSALGARIIEDTNFVTAWVFVGFLVYELAIYGAGINPEELFQSGGTLAAFTSLVPLVAVLAGFLPGCGPQIVITGLYISGVIPLSAQMGNAISNDGDALFPVLALAPRAAIWATVISGIPALFVGYGLFALGY